MAIICGESATLKCAEKILEDLRSPNPKWKIDNINVSRETMDMGVDEHGWSQHCALPATMTIALHEVVGGEEDKGEDAVNERHAGLMNISSANNWNSGIDWGAGTMMPGAVFGTLSIDSHDIKLEGDDKQMAEKRETLYEVIAADKNRNVVYSDFVIAKDREGAIFKSGLAEVLLDGDLDYDDVTIITSERGTVTVDEG